ncbi:cysteine desulfurase sulfur acceptor subunit CsdE [Grimontia hollisae]|uniref:Sulfur acceptor protein SufE for iron-sulfur cluster assembly n=2 Tax=Grimontia hollisae TaxID=673 RepID=D0ICQ4_GRIHO|nr:cysteine desulfurase sulfur acceptor subunit CsdE [Grimontia hollisae]AMG30035.1 cysteine desulfurase sulfur acceptor subunit CsdE [Grimontia hollisae]EEY71672.1 sulfur acceptor protein SufE for iron-sulfur cluster assembly [Grimontia hollisae CIP 101886]MDF2183649.1 cysteine desulfurase sulfur acceptor subunit CsdE [Grimontia hollisae]STO42810.1 Uncharacterized sufE-like protein ygdK [Grimontia hollisae]STO56611.1 Uncharacterized sufE-like protein ygdK [Grimontia hollisae]
MTSTFPSHPFGTAISVDDIIHQMAQCRSWEDKYRLVIQMGKKLPTLDESLKSESISVSGCESKVWLIWRKQDEKYIFAADSDARIVKGLLAIVLAAAEGKSQQALRHFNFEHYFEKLDLLTHLSQSRSNGIRSIVEQIKNI